jgi:hypothetical protein
MKPHTRTAQTAEMFRPRLDEQLNMKHPLIRLAGLMDMNAFSHTHCVCIRLRWIPPGISGQPHKATSPALRDLGVLQHLGDGLALALWD